MSYAYRLPPLPLGEAQARVARWLKQPGDSLAPSDPLLIVVSERAEVALPALVGGVLEAALAGEGSLVQVGQALARLGQPRAQQISPVAAQIARVAGVELGRVAGSGPGGRVMKRDVLAALGEPPPETAASPAPSAPARAEQPGDTYMLAAVEVDLGRVAAVCAQLQPSFAQRGSALTSDACVALAAVAELERHPLLNSAWSERGVHVWRRIHLAISDGRTTQVLRNAQDLNLRGVARALTPPLDNRSENDMATFSIVTGAEGGWWHTPTLAHSRSASLGVGAAHLRPIALTEGGSERIAVRPTLLLTLAYDVRVIDPSQADRFLRDLKARLEHFDA